MSKEMKERFEIMLRETGRKGIEGVLAGLAELGFYDAPASTKFHGSEKGGLLKHSLAVYDQAKAIREVQIRLCPKCAERLPLGCGAVVEQVNGRERIQRVPPALVVRTASVGIPPACVGDLRDKLAEEFARGSGRFRRWQETSGNSSFVGVNKREQI